MVTKTIAAFSLLAAVMAPVAGAAEGKENHGYGGGGLMLSSTSFDSSGGNEVTAEGGGIVVAGAGQFDLTPIVGIGVNGGFFVGSQTIDDTDVDFDEAQFDVNGGVVLWDLLYLSLGVQSLSQTFETTDITFTSTVIPLGVGVFKATDRGYILAQVRFGGGEATEDEFDTSQDLAYVGIRVVGQIGMAGGVQFLGGLEIEDYDLKDSDSTENYFRVFAGVAFGT